MTTIIKAHNPADLLAMVPALVGFEPRNSVVVLGFAGNRTCGALRYDLPLQNHEREVVDRIVATLLRIPTLDNVVIVIRTDRLFPARLGAPHVRLAKTLARSLRSSGIGVKESLCHAADGWASYLDPKTPPGGHPLSDIDSSLVHHEVPDDLREERMRPLSEGRIPSVEDTELDATAAQIAELEVLRTELAQLRSRPGAAFGLCGDDDRDWGALEVCRDLPLFFEGVLDWDAYDVKHGAGLLLFVLKGPPLRDRAMLQWATDLSVGDDLDPNPLAHAEVMLGEGARPDVRRIERAIAVLTAVIARAEDAYRPAPLCMLAWLNWALGRSSVAGRHLDEALTIDPNYSMAQLQYTILSNGMLPAWAFDPAMVE